MRKIIEHGRRIRVRLKQPELAPVSVPAQIAVLLALTAELYDVSSISGAFELEPTSEKTTDERERMRIGPLPFFCSGAYN